MHKIQIHAAARDARYDILIGSNLAPGAARFIMDQFRPHSCAVITDTNVAPLHLSKV